jgi:hypothetical protein
MPGNNPLIPAFPDIVFFAFIALFAVVTLAIIGGSILIAVIIVRRANSGRPLSLQAAEPHGNPFTQNQLLQNQMMQNQIVQEQAMQQQILNNNMFNGH